MKMTISKIVLVLGLCLSIPAYADLNSEIDQKITEMESFSESFGEWLQSIKTPIPDPDTDGDGIPDATDPCPDDAANTCNDVDPIPTPVVNLLLEEAATMQPGEWRNLKGKTNWPGKDTGRTFKQFQYVGIADGMGWTQPLAYHDGWLMMLIHRSDDGDEALMLMNPQGEFTRIEYPQGYLEEDRKRGGRRPFHRLMAVNGYLIFTPKSWTMDVGQMMRTPLANPGVWELWGPSIEDSQSVTNGAWASIYSHMWQRFYMYTAGGKIYSRAWDDTAWTQHSRLPLDTRGNRLSGVGGFLIENPVKQEILIAGGQEFGNAPLSYMAYKLTEPLGAPQLLADRRYPDGTLFTLKHGGTKILVLADGSYAIHTLQEGQRRQWYRTITGGGTTHLLDDFEDELPFANYESYAAITSLPGYDDVWAYISHIEGLGLYRVPSLAGLPTEPESDPVLLPDGHVPTPPVTATFDEIVAAVPSGGALEFSFELPEGFATKQEFWKRDGHSANQDMYGPCGHYDPSRQKLVYIKDRTPNGSSRNYILVLLYDLATGTVERGDVSTIRDFPWAGSPHTYCTQAYDASRGHAYYDSSSVVRRTSIDNGLWDQISASAPWNLPVDKIAPVAWHDGLDMLVRPQAQKNNKAHLMGWKDDQQHWRDLGSLGNHDPYQATSHYNRTRGDMLIVGGYNGSPDARRVTMIKNDGEIVRMNDIPLDPVTNQPIFGTALGQNWTALFHDPITGNYLYKSDSKFWEYDPDLDEWRLGIDFLAPENEHMYPGNYYGWVMIPMEDKGVIAILNYHRDQVYRHQSAFGNTVH